MSNNTCKPIHLVVIILAAFCLTSFISVVQLSDKVEQLEQMMINSSK